MVKKKSREAAKIKMLVTSLGLKQVYKGIKMS